MPRVTTKHHIIPRSRFVRGTPREDMDRNNIVELDDDVHRAIHLVFANLTREESLMMLDIILTPGTCWDHQALIKLRKSLRGVVCSSS